MAIKFSDIFHFKALKIRIPNLGFFGIKTYHLANLLQTPSNLKNWARFAQEEVRPEMLWMKGRNFTKKTPNIDPFGVIFC
jgi:hypothetical protein